jgi:hypothetical protein
MLLYTGLLILEDRAKHPITQTDRQGYSDINSRDAPLGRLPVGASAEYAPWL